MTSLCKEQKYYHFKKRAIPVDKLAYVKNINKLQNTEKRNSNIYLSSKSVYFLKAVF